MEAIFWAVNISGLILVKCFDKFALTNILFVIAVGYFASFSLTIMMLIKVRACYESNIIHDSFFVGLSNLVSGGVMSLAPSICFHLAGPLLAGAIGLMINIASVVLTILRAYLLKKIPELSSAIDGASQIRFGVLRREVQLKVNSMLFVSFLVVQFVMVPLIAYLQPELDFSKVLFFSFAVTAFVCVPQLSAVDSVVINFFGRSRRMLTVNSLQLMVTILVTMGGILFGGNPSFHSQFS